MKKLLTSMAIASMALLPFGMSAQTLSVSTNSTPGITVTTSPFGTGVGINTGLLNIVYASNGFYDCYGHYHRVGHKHRHHQHYCKICEKQYKKIRKEAEKRHRHHAPGYHAPAPHSYTSAPRPGSNGNHYGNHKNKNKK